MLYSHWGNVEGMQLCTEKVPKLLTDGVPHNCLQAVADMPS